MRRPGGYATLVEPGRPVVEFDTASCCHCSAAIRVKPNTASTTYLIFHRAHWRWEEVPGASCYHCMKPVCLACYATGICVPLERMLERLEGSCG